MATVSGQCVAEDEEMGAVVNLEATEKASTSGQVGTVTINHVIVKTKHR